MSGGLGDQVDAHWPISQIIVVSIVFGEPVVTTARLDRLHHAVVIQIEGSSYRLRQDAELMPSISDPRR